MKQVLVRAGLGVLGIVVTLGYWTIKDRFTGDSSASVEEIPSKVWEGGGREITVEAECSSAAVMRASFETNVQVDDKDHKYLATSQRLAAGSYIWKIDVPTNVGGTIELYLDTPEVGASSKVALKIDGKTVAEDAQTLEKPLQAGYAFGSQIEFEDYASGMLAED